MFSSPPLERPVSAPSCLVGLPPRLIHKNVTRNDEANNDWDLWKREGKSPSEVQNKWLKNVHKCLRSLPCLSIPASPSSANWATSTEMQFPHSHQGLFNFFTPEVGQSVRFWFRPQARVSEEMADMIMVVDMGEVVNKAIKITIQMKFNVQEELDRNYGWYMKDVLKYTGNVLPFLIMGQRQVSLA